MSNKDKKYKKSYEGDYSKTYRDSSAWEKEHAKQRRDYEIASKKLNENPYNKKEVFNSYSLENTTRKESDRVYAAGRKSPSANSRLIRNAENTTLPLKEFIDNAKVKDVAAKPKPALEQERTSIEMPKAVQPAPVIDEKQTINTNRTTTQDPLIELGGGKYKVVQTQKIVDTDSARNILKTSGYIPQTGIGLGTIVFIIIVSYIISSMIAPFSAFVLAYIKHSETEVTWIKVLYANVQKYKLPATQEKIATNKLIGKVCFVVGGVLTYMYINSVW